MQSCPKNGATGTGPTNKPKGPVSANNTIAMTENIPKIPSVSSNISCKVENNLAPTVVIKPENKGKIDLETSVSKSHDIYSHPKLLESPEQTPSPARGSTGLQIPPTVQHEAVQPAETNLNHSSDILSLSQRKPPRVGKSMERERQQQQHITMSGYQTTLESVNHHPDNVALEMVSQFKQEFHVKKEGEVKKEKDCDEMDTGYRNLKPIEAVKLERPETLLTQDIPVAPKQVEVSAVETVTVNLISESGDECIDYSMKRKSDDSGNDDVIELSDNSTVEPPAATLKRRKLLEKPIFTPKKSPPNSYKSLIKQSSPAATTYPSSTAKSKLISSSINRLGNKSTIKRRSILKSKSTLKKMRLAVKAKKRANKKKSVDLESDKSSMMNGEETGETEAVLDTTESIADNSCEASDKGDDAVEDTSTENEHNEEKSMDGSSEYSGKSNIDLTIDRVAKGYFSESDIFSCLSKHRKTKSQKKFAAKLLKSELIAKKKNKKGRPQVSEMSSTEKTKKKSKSKTDVAVDNEVSKTVKAKKAKAKEDEEKKKSKKKVKDVEVVEKDPLALDDVPSSHSTPKRKQKTSKATEKKTKKTKVIEVVEETAVEPPVIDSEEDDKTVETLEPRDEETSTTVLSSTQTINTTKSLLDETDVANNNNECFEDNNRQKQQESLTLYKTPGYGWTTFSKAIGKRGKKAKFGNRKKHKFTLLNDIVIPKCTSIPRWSNGWMWEGEPYQALVFLNVSFSWQSNLTFY